MQNNRIGYTVDGARIYGVALDEDHRNMLRQLMKRYGMPGASVVRLLIRTEASKRGSNTKPRDGR